MPDCDKVDSYVSFCCCSLRKWKLGVDWVEWGGCNFTWHSCEEQQATHSEKHLNHRAEVGERKKFSKYTHAKQRQALCKPMCFQGLSPLVGVSAGCEMRGEMGNLINNSNKREAYRVNKLSAIKACFSGEVMEKLCLGHLSLQGAVPFASSPVPFHCIGSVSVHKPGQELLPTHCSFLDSHGTLNSSDDFKVVTQTQLWALQSGRGSVGLMS